MLDEPFSGIDPITVLELLRIVFDLKRSGILPTGHNLREAPSVTGRAYIVDRGHNYRAGGPEAPGALGRIDLLRE